MPEYKLLQYHMDCNFSYLFDHAEVARLLASETMQMKTGEYLDNYSKYTHACAIRGISSYDEETYTQFMVDCKRIIKN